MANYEFMLIVDPRLSETDRNNSISNLKSVFEKYETKIESEDVWWDKKMAYKINKSEKWYYIVYKLDLDWKKIKDISKELNLDRNLIRYMFVKQEA